MERPSYYGILPANVRYDKKLKPMEKILYTEITALSNKSGYCNASNKYFSELYEVHKDTVSNWINNLKKQGYIDTVVIKEDKTKQVKERRIYINHVKPVGEKTDTYRQKDREGIGEKTETPIGKKTEENNTSSNITSNNSSGSSTELQPQQLEGKNIDFRNDITELRDIIINSTGENGATVDMVFKPVTYRGIIKPLLQKIKASKYLMGEKESKPRLYTFIRQDRIKEILAGFYDDFKTQEETKDLKTEYDSEAERKQLEEQDEFLKAIGVI